MSNSILKRARPRHLEPESLSDDKTSSSDFTIPNPDDIETLRMQLAEQEAIDRRLQKEREEKIMKAFEEKKTLLRRIAALKQKNEVATGVVQPEIIDQVEQLRTQEQRLLGSQTQKKGDPVVQQIKSYKALKFENGEGKDMSNVASTRDKGKQKEVGVRINEPSDVIQIQDLSPSNIELEKRRK